MIRACLGKGLLVGLAAAALLCAGCSDDDGGAADMKVVSDGGGGADGSGGGSDGGGGTDGSGGTDSGGGGADSGSVGDSAASDAVAGDASGVKTSIVVTGKVGGSVPSGAKVMLFWQVTSGSPDYVVKLGEATVGSGGSYRIELKSAPPALAKNAGILGVALIGLVGSGTTINDGDKVGKAPSFIGGAEGRALIWHDPSSKPPYQINWMSKFSAGYSCGKVDGKQGSFDTFAPVSCQSVDIKLSNDPKFPNWT